MEEDFKVEELQDTDEVLARCRKWFRAAVDKWQKWREEAKEDYKFPAGKQWTDEEIKVFKEDGRPAIIYKKNCPAVSFVLKFNRSKIKSTAETVGRKSLSRYFNRFGVYGQVFTEAIKCMRLKSLWQ